MSSERAKAHAKHSYFCSCGKVVFGNGGKTNHVRMHQTRDDGHRQLSQSQWKPEGFKPECTVCGKKSEYFNGKEMRCLGHKT